MYMFRIVAVVVVFDRCDYGDYYFYRLSCIDLFKFQGTMRFIEVESVNISLSAIEFRL